MKHKIDAVVILAGGPNERLQEFIPPYEKPFIEVDGITLIDRNIRLARTQCDGPIVIVTGTNQGTEVRARLRPLDPGIQPIFVAQDGGPGQALRAGLGWLRPVHRRVLVLMGDNYHQNTRHLRSFFSLLESGGGYAVGVRRNVDVEDALRFTVWDRSTSTWVEGVELPPSDEGYTVWSGPLVIDRESALDALEGQSQIGPNLDKMVPTEQHGWVLAHHPLNSFDLGTPEALIAFARSGYIIGHRNNPLVVNDGREWRLVRGASAPLLKAVSHAEVGSEFAVGPDRLEQMLALQLKLQREAYGIEPRDMPYDQRVEYLRTMMLAATDELHEALGETAWKTWAKRRDPLIDVDRYLGELVDAWHFFMNLLLVTGLTPEELARRLHRGYMAKHEINAQRQVEGYDGRSTKCGSCGRATDDPAVSCTPARREGDATYDGYCTVNDEIVFIVN